VQHLSDERGELVGDRAGILSTPEHVPLTELEMRRRLAHKASAPDPRQLAILREQVLVAEFSGADADVDARHACASPDPWHAPPQAHSQRGPLELEQRASHLIEGTSAPLTGRKLSALPQHDRERRGDPSTSQGRIAEVVIGDPPLGRTEVDRDPIMRTSRR
jgi:hypothetical protein